MDKALAASRIVAYFTEPRPLGGELEGVARDSMESLGALFKKVGDLWACRVAADIEAVMTIMEMSE